MRLYKHILGTCVFCAIHLSCMGFASPAPTVKDSVSAESTPVPQETQPQKFLGELWTGSLYSSTYRAGACIDNQGKIHGVLILTLKNGKEDVYHFQGTKDIQGTLRLKHSSGHHFKGNFENATTIKGKVTTKNGFSINLKGKREQDILLNGPSCRPF